MHVKYKLAQIYNMINNIVCKYNIWTFTKTLLFFLLEGGNFNECRLNIIKIGFRIYYVSLFHRLLIG